ncbi:amino acid aminotransferase [Frigidibacter sp. MR17.14]|uniref:amino acid aminotransferase n=1 Tax=Frigidibacter sp. MR17.14 TaxID=3126509 RepID=UPI003012DAF4
MLDALKPQAPDTILALMDLFRADTRAQKVDLGVGVFKDAQGRTPVMAAVKAAEQRIWAAQDTKTYTALTGDPAFSRAMAGLILGPGHDPARLAFAGCVGGTGAVHQALALVRMANPDATVWMPDPTWPNHPTIVAHLGLKARSYRYFDPETRGLDREGMLADLAQVPAGDVVLLHGCCHNPTGANPTPADWAGIAAALERSGALVLIDLAYQGFGDGLEEDAAATRLLAARLPQILIAASCSKNFGLYRDRAGVLLALGTGASQTRVLQDNLTHLNRQTYSFPPDHGARIVTEILGDASLRAAWVDELAAMRAQMLTMRQALARVLRDRSGSDRFGFLAEHRGMFSRLGASPAQVARLRDEAGIYMIGDSRMNVAGLYEANVPVVAQAILDIGL